MKGEIDYKNKTFKITDVRKMVNEVLLNVTVDDWKKCVKHGEITRGGLCHIRN